MKKKVRVRYAPSPTGLLHIGNARSALFNYLFARHFNGDFIIRIEDTDVLRNVEGGEESQLNYLKWLGLSWDESPDKGGPYGPYRQLERLDLYIKYANELLERGLAYKEYREGSNKFAIRMKVPQNETYKFTDVVRGELSFESKEVEDWVIVKDNGIPTYNFAVVIDDHFMEITHVLRGEEHITNTPKQIMVYQAFGWDVPLFGHMTIIVNEQKKKLSKRDKNVVQFISEYEAMGYLPEAMFNFIALLGWSPQGNKEILNQNQIIMQFDPKRLSKAPAMFDKDKLAYINSRYIKKLPIDDLAQRIKPFLEKDGIEIPNDEWLKLLASVFKDRLSYIGEITKLYHEFFHDDFKLSEEAYQFLVENQSLELIETFKSMLGNMPFEVEKLDQAIKDVSEKLGITGMPLYMGIRIAATGDMHGPSLAHCMTLLEKDRVMNRLQKVADKLRGDL